MLIKYMLSGLLAGLLMCAPALAQDDYGGEADQNAIRDAIVSYVKAMNEADAAAAAKCWSEEGVWIDPAGQQIVGVAEIEKHLVEMFAAGGGPKIELLNIDVRFIAPNVATEEGEVIITRPGQPPQRTTYITIHTRTGDGWKLNSVRETVIPTPATNYQYLQELEWMIGDWVDSAGDLSVETTCEWTTNQNFMLRTFRATNGDVVEMEGTQVVGWDAARQQIRSWVFDSDGGFGHGVWARDEATWIVESEFQDATGLKGSSRSSYTYVDADTFKYQSTNRVLDGQPLPDVDPITISRVQPTEAPAGETQER